MRTLSSSFMAALIVVALFWGNCLSCPQMLLGMKAHHPSHDCCKRNQKPAKSCDSQGLQNFLKANDGTVQAAAPVVAVADAAEVPTAPALPEVAVQTGSPVYSPPDLLALHSSFRI